VLGFVASYLAGDRIAKVRDRVRPNPFAPRLGDQAAIATAQAASPVRNELADGFTGLTGSESEWFGDQGSHSVGFLPIAQELAGGVPLPPAWTTPGDPGADTSDPIVLADFFRGPVVLGGARAPGEPTWGGSARSIANGAQVARTGRLNPPGLVTPDAAGYVAARGANVPAARADALLGLWSD
jgi:hypothetical protein